MNELTQLQADLQALHETSPYFADIAIFARTKGLLESDVQDALKNVIDISGRTTKPGIAVTVMMPLIECPDADPAGPRLDIIAPINVVERPDINRIEGGTEKEIEAVVLASLQLIHGRLLSKRLGQVYADKRAAEPVETGDDKVVSYNIYYRSRLALNRAQRVSTPHIAGDASAVQLSCNTPGAVLYYTTDGSFPWEGNESATLYGTVLVTEDNLQIGTENGDAIELADPIVVPTGAKLRVVAFKSPAMDPSDVAEHQF